MLVIFEEDEQATQSRPSWKRTGQLLISRHIGMWFLAEGADFHFPIIRLPGEIGDWMEGSLNNEYSFSSRPAYLPVIPINNL
jgi:hypothetical protein